MPDPVATPAAPATPPAAVSPPAAAEPAGSSAAPPVTAAAPGAAAASDAAPASSPAEAAPAAAPVADVPASDGAAAPDAKPQSTPSLLEAAEAKVPAKEGDKPAEAAPSKDGAPADKPADGAKPATEAKPEGDKPKDGDGKPAPAKEALAEKPQARSYEAFKVPDGVALAEKDTKEFTGILDDDKLSHQERAQKLVDLYVREAQRIVNDQVAHQRKVWTDYTEQLKSDLKSDPEMGGNRIDTTLGIAKAVVERFGGTKEQVNDMLAMMTHTGMGNYVGVVRLLNNIYEQAVSPRIVPGNPPSRNAGRRSFSEVAYGDNAQGNGAAS